jgi:hypothetical protein
VEGNLKKISFMSFFMLFVSFCLFCQEAENSQKILFEGYIKELLKAGKVGYALVENGAVVKEGTLTDNSLSLPKAEECKTRTLLFKPDDMPPFVVRLKGGEKSITTEKIELKEVKPDLSMYPKDAKITWFLKEWDDIPFDLFPGFTCGRISGKVMKLPAKEDVFIEIRAKGLLPTYTVSKAGQSLFKPELPITGWCKEVRVKNMQGKWLSNCFTTLIRIYPYGVKFPPIGKAIQADDFGRAVLIQDEMRELSMVVVLGSGLTPSYFVSEKPSDKPLIISLEKGEKISGKVMSDSGKSLKTDISYKMTFDNPLFKEGTFQLKTKEDGTFEIAFPGVREGFSLSFFSAGYELQTFDESMVGSPLIIRLKQEKPIVGRVEDEKGLPVPGAVLKVKDSEFKTDVSGNFILGNLKGYTEGWVEALGYFPHKFKIEYPQPFLRIVLEKSRGIIAKLADIEGKPVEEVALKARYECGSLWDPITDAKLPCKNGFFRDSIIDGITSDCLLKADLTLFSRGYVPLKAKGIEVPLGEVVDLGTLIFERGFEVTGRVKLEDGTPAVGAKVILLSLEEDEKEKNLHELAHKFIWEKNSSVYSSTSNNEGEFKIDGLYNGVFVIFIEYPLYQPYEEKIELSGHASLGEFTLGEGRTLTVKVYSRKGTPKENCFVRVFPEDSDTLTFIKENKIVTTSAEGIASFEGLRTLNYSIEVLNLKKELLAKETIDLTEKSTTKEIYLPGGNIELTLTYGGAPLANREFYIAPKTDERRGYDSIYSFYLLSKLGGKLFRVMADTGGKSFLDDFEKGDYVLFSHDLPFQAVKTFSVGDDKKLTLELKGVKASGKLTIRSGKNLKGRSVSLFTQPSLGYPVIRTETDEQGIFTFSNLEPSEYTLYLSYSLSLKKPFINFTVKNSDITLEPIEIDE